MAEVCDILSELCQIHADVTNLGPMWTNLGRGPARQARVDAGQNLHHPVAISGVSLFRPVAQLYELLVLDQHRRQLL